MADYNFVVLMGRLARDPELKYTPSGTAVCDFSLAVNERWTDKDGKKHEKVAFFDVVSWKRQAEIIAEYLKKGSGAMVTGKLNQERWDDKSTGQKRSKITVTAERVQFLDRKTDAAGESTVPEELPPEEAK